MLGAREVGHIMGPVRRRWPLEIEPNKCNQTSASIIHRMYTYEYTPSGPLLVFSYLSYMAFVGILVCDCYIIALLNNEHNLHADV